MRKLAVKINFVVDSRRIDSFGDIFLKYKDVVIGQLGFIVNREGVYVISLFVKEEYRGKGFGRMLMRIIQSYAEMLNKPLVVYSTNETVEFYKKLGFKKIDDSSDPRDLYWLPEKLKRSKRKIKIVY